MLLIIFSLLTCAAFVGAGIWLLWFKRSPVGKCYICGKPIYEPYCTHHTRVHNDSWMKENKDVK